MHTAGIDCLDIPGGNGYNDFATSSRTVSSTRINSNQ